MKNHGKVLIALLVFAVLAGVIYAYGQQQFGLGEKAERAAWLKRENAQLTTANAKIKDLEEKYRQQEQDAADAIAIISYNYQKDLRDVQFEKDRILAGISNGTYRLRIPVAARLTAYGSGTAEAAASACGCDAGTRAELSGSAAEFLVGLASEADEVTKQLGRCQEIIKADRKTGEGNVGE